MARLQNRYREEVFPQLQKEFELTNPMQVPKISKITCNIGVGEASRNAKLLDVAVEQLANITGQKPEVRRARKSIAGRAVGPPPCRWRRRCSRRRRGSGSIHRSHRALAWCTLSTLSGLIAIDEREQFPIPD